MCNFCNGEKIQEKGEVVSIQMRNDRLVVKVDDDNFYLIKSFGFKFCPMCGKEVKL